MKLKKSLFTLISFFLFFALTACSSDRTAGVQATTKNKNSDEIVVIDYLGREVAVPKEVKRIACLYAYTGHVVTMLGAGNKMVATNMGLQRDTLLHEINPTIKGVPVPNRGDKVNIEELANTNPDLILIQESMAMDEGEVRKLEELKVPYLVASFNSMKEQQQSIAMIGEAIGKVERAKKFNQYYNETISLVSEKVKDIPDHDRVRVYHSVMQATRTDSTNSLSAEWIKAAGAVNVAVDQKLKLVDKQYIASLEQILLWDPDVILANQDGVGDYILESPAFHTLQAVKNKKVYQLPNGVSRWGHPGGLETPLAILWTAKTLYPDKFKDTNMEEVTAKFYEDFFNYKLTPDLMKKILAGKDMRTPKGNK